MNKSPQYNQQSKSQVEEICIYQNMESGRHSIYIWKCAPCQKESQATISESSHVQWSFIQQKVHLCLRPRSLDNTLNRPSSAREGFNVRRKLGLFCLFLGVTHNISNLPTVCVKLMQVGGWVYHCGLEIWHMKYRFLLKPYLILRKKY